MDQRTNTLTFWVNGSRHDLGSLVSLNKTLLTFIRDDLGLMGAKLSCGEGGCGACTVTLTKIGKRGVKHR